MNYLLIMSVEDVSNINLLQPNRQTAISLRSMLKQAQAG